ncbi:DUF2169 domain-containing protein [Sorangium sp. So ce118]
MDFQNLTPFSALTWFTEELDRSESQVFALAVGYRLVASAEGGDTHRAEPLEGADAIALAEEDRYAGAPLASSVRAESDLVPRKARCDVIVNAAAHAPGGEPAARFTARVRLVGPRGEALIDKAIGVTGPRWFERTARGWRLGDPEPARAVPVRWEHAYGGASRVPSAGLNEVCVLNPLGCGWMDARYLEALERAGEPLPERLPAPQIEDPRRPVAGLDVVRQPPAANARQMAEAARAYGDAPVGLGAIGRAWTPRLQRAGTYDEAWLRDGWPHLPTDFDFAHWNAAPDDQQIDELPPGARLTLTNLVAPEHAPGGELRVTLPAPRAVVRLHATDGTVETAPLRVDLLLVDAEAMRLAFVYRTTIPRAHPAAIALLELV